MALLQKRPLIYILISRVSSPLNALRSENQLATKCIRFRTSWKPYALFTVRLLHLENLENLTSLPQLENLEIVTSLNLLKLDNLTHVNYTLDHYI